MHLLFFFFLENFFRKLSNCKFKKDSNSLKMFAWYVRNSWNRIICIVFELLKLFSNIWSFEIWTDVTAVPSFVQTPYPGYWCIHRIRNRDDVRLFDFSSAFFGTHDRLVHIGKRVFVSWFFFLTPLSTFWLYILVSKTSSANQF